MNLEVEPVALMAVPRVENARSCSRENARSNACTYTEPGINQRAHTSLNIKSGSYTRSKIWVIPIDAIITYSVGESGVDMIDR